MSTMISLQTILWSALAAAAGIGLPVLVLLVWKFKFCRGAKLFPAVVGAVTFVVFAQVLEGVPKAIFFGGGTGVSQYVLTHAWAYTLIGCLLAFATGTSWGTFGVLIPITIAILRFAFCSSAIPTGGTP